MPDQTTDAERLRQALWDVYRSLGFDTDGDENPPPDSAISPSLVDLVTAAAREYREQHEGDYGLIDDQLHQAIRDRNDARADNERLTATLGELTNVTAELTKTALDRSIVNAGLNQQIADYRAAELAMRDQRDAARAELAAITGSETETGVQYGHVTKEVGWVFEPRGINYATGQRRFWFAAPERVPTYGMFEQGERA